MVRSIGLRSNAVVGYKKSSSLSENGDEPTIGIIESEDRMATFFKQC